jgi:hypothetical protein
MDKHMQPDNVQLIRPASIKIDADNAIKELKDILSKPIRFELDAVKTIAQAERLADRLESQAVSAAWWAGCGAGGLSVGGVVLVVAIIASILGRAKR